MKNVIVPLNSFSKHEVFEKGQQFFVPLIAEAGAYGVEIRRELFLEDEVLPLSEIRKEAVKYNLFIVYSAPVEVWKEDGTLNEMELQQIVYEAKQLGASWVKTSLGHYDVEHSNINELNNLIKHLELCENDMLLMVENDQTMHGGHCKRFFNFFENVAAIGVPVKMTFDLGNWSYAGQDAVQAMEQLFTNVVYLHLKHVVHQGDRFETLPLPHDECALWRKAISFFPKELIKAIEFPIEPVERLKEYIEMVQDGVRK